MAAKKKSTAKPKAKTKPKAKAKAKAKKETPKVSELRGVSMETWSKRLKGWHVDALRIIRALVARHAPTATLSIKWGQPVWEHQGPIAFAKPAKNHLTFGFWRGAEMKDPSGVLEGEGNRMRHVKITSAEHARSLPLEDFVKQAVQLNEKKGDPTKR
jgi:hypothetical protein